jgi:type IV pilus assembly protein PilO
VAFADRFRNLNWNKPWTLPWLPKLIMVGAVPIALLVVAWGIDWRSQLEELEAGQNEEVKLKEAYKSKKVQAVNLDLHREQLREINTSFGALLKQLPNKSQMEALIVEINQAGLGRGLQFDLFKPAPQESVREFYAELPISLKIVGTYHDLGAFATDIGQMSRIVTLNDIALSVSKDGNLLMDTVAKTFRYLDDEEVAAQKRARDAAKKATTK